MDDCFWLFPATLQKLGTGNIAWKTSDEYSLSRNTNLRSTVEVYNIYIYIYIYFLSGFFLTVLFTFSMFFLSFSVLFYFVLLLLIKKDYFKLRID